MSGRQDPVDTFGRGKSKGKWGEDRETWRSKERERLRTEDKVLKNISRRLLFLRQRITFTYPSEARARPRSKPDISVLIGSYIHHEYWTQVGERDCSVASFLTAFLLIFKCQHTGHGTERGTDYKRLVPCSVPFPQNLRFLLCQRWSRHESTRVPQLRSFLHQPPQIT